MDVPLPEDHDHALRAGVGHVWRLARPYRPWLTLAFVCMLLESAADVWEPWPLKVIFDHVLGSKPLPPAVAAWAPFGTSRLGVLDAAVLAVMLLAIIGGVTAYAAKSLSTAVGEHVMHDVRQALYQHVQRLSLPFFERHRTGDLVLRLTDDIDTAQDFVSSTLLGTAMDMLTLVGMLAVMLYLDWRFAVLSLTIAPALFAVVSRRSQRIKQAAREVKQKESAVASIVQETIASIRTMRVFGREQYEHARLGLESANARDAALRARKIKSMLPLLVDLVVAAGTCLVLLVGVRLVLSDSLTSGTLLVFVLYLGKLYKPMKNLSRMSDSFAKVSVAFERIGELLRAESVVTDTREARPAPPLRGRIELRGVHFGYVPDRPVLRGIDLTIEPGMHAAIVGPTGAGKSTMLALLLRLYDPQAGGVRIDGRDVRSYTLQSLRDQISLVPQEPILFHGPVWRNIAYGRPGASRDEIVEAATLAHAHEFISRMPQGYDTIIGERGDTLSGGQRQRIAIARAVIRRAPILLMDEPSSALDPESEELVFDALAQLMERCTSITIAHRMATVRRADAIFLLDNGVISANGTHQKLLANHQPYARLYRLQFPDIVDTRVAAPTV